MENNFSYEINTEKREIVYNCSGDENFFEGGRLKFVF